MNMELQGIIDDIKRLIDEVLNEALEQIKAIYVLDKEGTVIAQDARIVSDFGQLFFTAPKLMSSLKGLISALPLGNINYVLIQGNLGIIQIMSIKDLGYLMVIINDESSIGLIKVILDKYIDKIYDALSRLTKASEEQFIEVIEVEVTPKDVEDVINFIKSKMTF